MNTDFRKRIRGLGLYGNFIAEILPAKILHGNLFYEIKFFSVIIPFRLGEASNSGTCEQGIKNESFHGGYGFDLLVKREKGVTIVEKL